MMERQGCVGRVMTGSYEEVAGRNAGMRMCMGPIVRSLSLVKIRRSKRCWTQVWSIPYQQVSWGHRMVEGMPWSQSKRMMPATDPQPLL